jgi:hypothetical protein
MAQKPKRESTLYDKTKHLFLLIETRMPKYIVKLLFIGGEEPK